MESNDFPLSVVSIVEDVLQHYSTRSNDAGSLLPRKLEESCEFLSPDLMYPFVC